MKDVRTRFAPSPTGFMHVGGIRTAFFAWAIARHNQGSFILRVEDTDKNREVEGSTEHIIEALDWLGINRDEGPVAGGEYGPYKQSDRLEIYKEYAQKLIDSGLAYVDPYTQDEVTAFRQQAKDQKQAFLFRRHRPEDMTVPEDWYGRLSLRLKTPEIKEMVWKDVVRGRLSAGEDALDDFVLIKADKYPTYNFAHVVDDTEMKITHVVRGEEFIASTPRFLSLYEALNIEPPIFVTAPPILNSNGGKKLSKRDGAKDVLEYRDEGYPPESVLNFLASLGWNDGTDKEIYTPEELIEAFTADRIQKSGAQFDETKLAWINWQHLVKLIDTDLPRILAMIDQEPQEKSQAWANLAATKSRNLEDFKDQYSLFTTAPDFAVDEFDLTQVDKKLDLETAKKYLSEATTALEATDFSATEVEAALRQKMQELEASPRAFLNLIRWTLSNRRVSPGLFETIELLGKEETLRRLSQ